MNKPRLNLIVTADVNQVAKTYTRVAHIVKTNGTLACKCRVRRKKHQRDSDSIDAPVQGMVIEELENVTQEEARAQLCDASTVQLEKALIPLRRWNNMTQPQEAPA